MNGCYEKKSFTIIIIQRGRKKTWIHTPTHLFPTLSRDWLPTFSCYLVFLYPNPREHCGNEERLQICVSCTTVPSIACTTKSWLKEGEEEEEQGQERGKERKMPKYLRYKIRNHEATLWTHFPFEESLTANWQRAGAEEEEARAIALPFFFTWK